MSTKWAIAPIKIVLAVMAALLASGCASIQLKHLDSSDADKQVRFEIQTPLEKAELFTQLNIATNRIFRSSKTVIQYQDKDAGVITGSYVSAYGSYTGFNPLGRSSTFSVEQTVVFDMKASDDGSVILELQTDDYVPSDDMLTKGDLKSMRITGTEKPGELLYLTATELQASWKVFADKLANELGGKLK